MAKFFKLWVKNIVGAENIPSKGPAIFVCNHRSYFDFIIFGSIIPRNIVFLAQRKISQASFIGWLTRFHNVIYVDREYPGCAFFKRLLRHLDAGKLLVIYPEGTRSRTGKMLMPKLGFVKLAMKANAPIIPVAMKGTYEILPPNKYMPKLKRCKVIVGKKIYVSPDNPYFQDVFFRRAGERKFSKLINEELQEIAIRIMDNIRILAGEDWDDSVIKDINRFERKREEIKVSRFAWA